MAKNLKLIPDDIKKDWRLSYYLVVSGLLGLLAMVFNFFPSFQISLISTGVVIDNVSGWIAHFGGTSVLSYVPNYVGISALVLLTLAAIAALVFTLLIRIRRVEGHRRFSLVFVALVFNGLGMLLLFFSVIPLEIINNFPILAYHGVYHFGLVFQSMVICLAILMQWFFLIKIKHYIK
jgi:hypothetical protein